MRNTRKSEGREYSLSSLLSKLCIVHCALCIVLVGCKSRQTAVDVVAQSPVGPTFVADSAFAYCEAQCQFGPRTMNSEAHEKCAQWIIGKFEQFGCEVTTQEATLKGYDGTSLKSKNIIASYRPKKEGGADANDPVVLLCAHWDSRPWADNDPDSTNWRKPVLAANDGASGVAVMLEIARLLQQCDSLRVGVDFVCFDAEDWGTPQWDTTTQVAGDPWALGAQYWAAQQQSASAPTYAYGILLDMVGGQGARFAQEGMSKKHAQSVIDRVWSAAKIVGFGSYFPDETGGYITDDHIPVNEVANIPCIDIIPYYPDCEQSSFGPTWHTVHDDMEHIDKNTLQAVGQTLVQVLFETSN